MKKLVIAASGHPRTNNDLIHLQEAIMEVASSLGKMCANDGGDPVLISGAIITDLGGGNNSISSAWWFIAGELYFMPAVATVIGFPDWLRITSTFAANNPYLGHSIHNIRQVIATSASFVAGDIDFLVAINNRAEDNIAKRMVNKAWQRVNAAGSAFYPQFYPGIVNVSGHDVHYRKTASGKYEFKGRANVGGYSGGSSSGGYPLINFGGGPVTTSTPQSGATRAINSAEDQAVLFQVDNAGIQIKHALSYDLFAGDQLYMTGISFYETY